MTGLCYNALTYFVRFVGEYNELNVLSCTVDKHIQRIGIDHQCYVAEYYHPYIVEDGPAGCDDQEVQNQQGPAKGYVTVFVH